MKLVYMFINDVLLYSGLSHFMHVGYIHMQEKTLRCMHMHMLINACTHSLERWRKTVKTITISVDSGMFSLPAALFFPFLGICGRDSSIICFFM